MIASCRGLGVALATPFLPDGAIDQPALVRLVQHVAAGGASFVVALGSTGEAPMLSEAERDFVVTTVLRHKGPLAVFVGTGASSTAQASAWTRRAAALGADGALVVVPPYTRPTQAGLLAHFRTVAAAAPELPILLYNVPPRTGTNLLPATVTALWSTPNIVGIKESSGDLQQIGRIAAALPPGKLLLAGDDGLAVATIAVGGHGLISVAGNAVPRAMQQLVDAALHDPTRARVLQAALQPLFDALSAEPNPIPAKAALALLGICEPAMRLPLLPAAASTVETLRAALHAVPTEIAHA
jgi:4-hydroxy-tetrahydrodipicolinate synthase